MKKVTLKLLTAALVLFMFSCTQDEIPTEFTLKSAIEDSTEIAKKVRALNELGKFYNFNIQILDGNKPVEGAQVEFTSSENGETSVRRLASDENGNIAFNSVTVGGNLFTIKKEGFYSTKGVVDFSFEEGVNYEVVGTSVIPIPRNESAIIPLYGKGEGSSLGTIKGKVFIESDLTNKSAESPIGTTIKANFAGNDIISSDGLKIKEYTLNSDGGLGTGKVASDGSYEIKVPVAIEGADVSLILPEIQMDQKLAINGVRDSIDSIQILNVPASFGKGLLTGPVPKVPGVKAEFPEPEAEGEGFAIKDIERLGRALFSSGVDLSPVNGVRTWRSNTKYRFLGGSNYKSTPELVVTDEKGSGFNAFVQLGIAIQEVKMKSIGKYNPNWYVRGDISYVDTSGSFTSFTSFSVNTNSNGEISQEIVNDVINERISRGYSSGWGQRFYNVPRKFDSLVISFDSPGGIANGERATAELVFDSRINRIKILKPGSEYLNPVFKFEGGNPEQAAVFELVDFNHQYVFKLDNSGITSPYVFVPNIVFEYKDDNNYYRESTTVSYIGDENLYSRDPLLKYLTTDENGHISYINNDVKLKTGFFSSEKPSVFVNNPVHAKPTATVSVSNGKVQGLIVGSYGRGYKGRFEIKIVPIFEGVLGDGAQVRIKGGSASGQEYQWRGGYVVENQGEGYLDNVNVVSTNTDFFISGPESFFLSPGETVYRDIHYGTGRRDVDIY